MPINEPLLEGKANDFAVKLGMDAFVCSHSWVQCFPDKHRIVFGKIHDKAKSVDKTICNDWLQNVWPKIRRDYADEDIFNADEAGIFFKLTPDKTF